MRVSSFKFNLPIFLLASITNCVLGADDSLCLFDASLPAVNKRMLRESFVSAGQDKSDLIAIFQQTQDASQYGYRASDGSWIEINPASTKEMQQRTMVFHSRPKLKNTIRRFKTEFSVVNQDSLYGAREFVENGEHPLVLNLANAQSPGGGVRGGSRAQEEDLMRCTNYSFALFPELNPALARQLPSTREGVRYRIPETGAILTPRVTVIRDGRKNYIFLDRPYEVDMLASAAYNLKPGHWGGPRGSIGPNGKASRARYDFEVGTKEKMRTQLTIAANAGYTVLVLGAFGCGAFLNPPEKIARWYKELFDTEFQGLFKSVRFSILGEQGKARLNFEIFSETFSS
jgi:uncharacterized protein (TIGR02452 family)